MSFYRSQNFGLPAQGDVLLKIERFRHIAVIVRDLDRMIDFYTRTLGFIVKRRFEIGNEDFQRGVGIPEAEAKGAHLAIPNSDVEIELFQFKDTKTVSEPLPANTQGYRHIALVVSDLETTWRGLTAANIQFLSEPITVREPKEVAGFKFVYLKDPEGNIIELNQLPSGA